MELQGNIFLMSPFKSLPGHHTSIHDPDTFPCFNSIKTPSVQQRGFMVGLSLCDFTIVKSNINKSPAAFMGVCKPSFGGGKGDKLPGVPGETKEFVYVLYCLILCS